MSAVIKSSDTGQILTFDSNGQVLNNTDGCLHLWDAMRKEYKRCGRCHKYYLLDSYGMSSSPKSKDGHVSMCPECMKKKDRNSTVTEDIKEKAPSCDEKNKKLKDVAGESIQSERGIAAVLPDEIIIGELRKRGYRGKLTVSKEITL